MSEPKHVLVQLIDAAVEQDAANEPPFRDHLGGSMIGEKCERKLVYSFRWAKAPAFSGRMLRLFGRGHLEEFRFVSYLRRIGATVEEYSERLMYHPESDSYFTEPYEPVEPLPEGDGLSDDVSDDPKHVEIAKTRGIERKQWRILDVDGHFGGSLDGKAYNVPGMPDLAEKILTEFKTHNTKSFVELVAKGVQVAKPIHYVQMQIYMHKTGIRRALYMAVNKNDDDLYCEWVEYDPAMGPPLLEKASRVIHARALPKRIGNNASWMDCKFCDFKGICHFNEPMLKSCRSCTHSVPVAEGRWHCDLWQSIIPVDSIPLGCDSYSPITD